jgi:hypothetical protein
MVTLWAQVKNLDVSESHFTPPPQKRHSSTRKEKHARAMSDRQHRNIHAGFVAYSGFGSIGCTVVGTLD